jgi:hypothetical protein
MSGDDVTLRRFQRIFVTEQIPLFAGLRLRGLDLFEQLLRAVAEHAASKTKSLTFLGKFFRLGGFALVRGCLERAEMLSLQFRQLAEVMAFAGTEDDEQTGERRQRGQPRSKHAGGD